MCWTFLLCFRVRYPQCCCAGRGAHRSPVMDVPVITQLLFLQFYEMCLRFRFSTECYRFQLCYRGAYAQCKLCKNRRFHRAVLRRCLRALYCALTGAGWSRQCRKCEVSARVLGHGSCPSLCNDRLDGRDSAENC